ncbi:hypothetical protein BZA05DRAFT_390774 [Tricharina praecox]|uniref:uncharacterized protein n=1 Tax=Tricharina praecox TaxID=43433 RepID=UPI00221F1132|nr:uncharacterized protein BZA05DRAFT_390774 [Tricharina praecox]KAI5855186.1 hypothetical protein BZA05DRAFT_390774 [Tricharina praecox]
MNLLANPRAAGAGAVAAVADVGSLASSISPSCSTSTSGRAATSARTSAGTSVSGSGSGCSSTALPFISVLFFFRSCFSSLRRSLSVNFFSGAGGGGGASATSSSSGTSSMTSGSRSCSSSVRRGAATTGVGGIRNCNGLNMLRVAFGVTGDGASFPGSTRSSSLPRSNASPPSGIGSASTISEPDACSVSKNSSSFSSSYSSSGIGEGSRGGGG